jgi:hypothetical protein
MAGWRERRVAEAERSMVKQVQTGSPAEIE